VYNAVAGCRDPIRRHTASGFEGLRSNQSRKSVPDVGTAAQMKIVCTSLPPLELLAAPGVQVANPFCGAGPAHHAASTSEPPGAEVWLPRNLSRHTLKLAELLSRWRPDAALYLNPVDPREYLALYEAWQSASGTPFEILPLTVHSRLDLESRLDSLAACFQKIGLEAGINGAAAFREAGRAWAAWERHAFTAGEGRVADACRQALSALENPGWLAGPPPVPVVVADREQADGPVPPKESRGVRLGIFGDWLLGDELFDFLDGQGVQVAFIQKVFDPFQWNWEHSPDRAWAEHPTFRPMADNLRLYEGILADRSVAGILGIYSTFSLLKARESWLLSSFGRPALVLETELPGQLTAQDRIRLENFIFTKITPFCLT